MDFSTTQLIAQGFGFLGLIFIVISFQKNDRNFTLMLHFLTGISLVVHFYMLGAMTAAFTSSIVTIRALVKFYSNKISFFNTKTMMSIVLAALWIVPIFTWDGVLSLLPSTLMTFETFGLWDSSNSKMRSYFLAGRPFAITYNAAVGSIAGIFIEVFLVSSLLISVYRFDMRQEEPEKLAIEE